MFHRSFLPLVLILASDAGGKSGGSTQSNSLEVSLEAQLAEAKEQLAVAKANIAQMELTASEKAVVTPGGKPWPASLILTRSQLTALEPKQQAEFRSLNGTVTEDAVAEAPPAKK